LNTKAKQLDVSLTDIVLGCQKGTPLMQKKLYELYYHTMIKVAYRYTQDIEKAATVYNNAMLKVFNAITNYQEKGNLQAWIKQIVIHSAIDFVRVKNNFQEHAPITQHNEDEHFIDNAVFEKMDSQAIRTLINTLPEKLAAVFNLFVYEEYSHQEIAELLQIPIGTSRYYLSEARRLLKEKITNTISSPQKTYSHE
jgi:RNA polymerase sigma factor (sigma-70 family)